MAPRPVSATLAPPEDDVRRREFLALLAAAGLVAGCGGTDARDADAAAALRGFTDSVGRRVEIPQRAERIVSLHEATSGAALLSVGAPVVGMVKDPDLPFRPYDHEDIAATGSFAEPDLEAIAALRPDVIVAYSNDGTVYPEGLLDELEPIAPTVAFGEDLEISAYMRAVADITGLDDEVDRQRAAYERELAELRAAVPQARDLTFVMAGGADAEVYVFVPTNATASVAVPQAIGVQTAGIASRTSDDGLYVILSSELLGDIDADVILYDDFGASITEFPLWPTLPAVRAGQAHLMPTSFGASYVNYRRALPALREALGGAMPLRLAADGS